MFIFGDKIEVDSSDPNKYNLTGAVTINNSNKSYFPILIEDGFVFDGGSNTITYEGDTEWDGLFVSSAADHTFTILNTIFDLYGSDLSNNNGCFISDMGYNSNTITITNCHSSSTNSKVINDNGGGIVGRKFGINTTCIISDCSNSLEISGDNSGGICGQYAGQDGILTIENCTNTGKISGHSAGGICGQDAGKDGTSLIIKYCSNTGGISGETDSSDNQRSAGGICGRDAGNGCDEFLIQYCWNEGNMTGDGTGGICGIYSGGGNGSHRIEYCYNSGDFEASYAGGICGRNARNMIIFNCYNKGNVLNSVDRCGGITGNDTSSNTDTKIYNCYNAGSISSNATNCGGIIGGSYDRVIVKNCYWLGTATTSVYGAGSIHTDSSNNFKTPLWLSLIHI